MKLDLKYVVVVIVACLIMTTISEFKSWFGIKDYEPALKTQEVNWTEITKQANIWRDTTKARLRAEIKPRTRFILKTDTIRPNIDSLWSEAKNYWRNKLDLEMDNYDYIAYLDTNVIMKDSSGQKTDSLALSIEYESPIPLHPEAFFRTNISHTSYTRTNYKQTTFEIPKQESFWDRFNTVIYVGAGYDFLQKIPTVNVGIGFGINLKRIF